MQRVLEPELLDQLPADHRDAIRSRSDLRRLNAVMGNVSRLAAPLRGHAQPQTVMDLGAGDGSVALALARRLGWRNTHFLLVDRSPAVQHTTLEAFAAQDCRVTVLASEVLAAFSGETEVAVANLFLHHLDEHSIRQLFLAAAQCCAVFVACEPRRCARALLASRCVGALGCNAITRHDAVVSVRAGFTGNELSALWPDREQWLLAEEPVGLFGHRFVARRK